MSKTTDCRSIAGARVAIESEITRLDEYSEVAPAGAVEALRWVLEHVLPVTDMESGSIAQVDPLHLGELAGYALKLARTRDGYAAETTAPGQQERWRKEAAAWRATADALVKARQTGATKQESVTRPIDDMPCDEAPTTECRSVSYVVWEDRPWLTRVFQYQSESGAKEAAEMFAHSEQKPHRWGRLIADGTADSGSVAREDGEG